MAGVALQLLPVFPPLRLLHSNLVEAREGVVVVAVGPKPGLLLTSPASVLLLLLFLLLGPCSLLTATRPGESVAGASPRP